MNTKIFYMVYVEGGRGPACKHWDFGQAEKEAQRLAKETGQMTYV